MYRALALVFVWMARLAAGAEENAPMTTGDESLAEAIAAHNEEEERRLSTTPAPTFVTDAPI